MKKIKPQFLILFFLTVLFCLPGLAAYWFYTHPHWLSSAKTNKGILLNPPYQMHSMDSKKWHLYYWQPNTCKKKCLSELDQLARIRLALGRKLYEVDLQWLRSEDSPELSSQLRADLRDLDIQVKRVPSEDLRYFSKTSESIQVYIANPDDFLIMAYSKLNRPMDIYQDLKHLLSIPVRSGGGNA